MHSSSGATSSHALPMVNSSLVSFSAILVAALEFVFVMILSKEVVKNKWSIRSGSMASRWRMFGGGVLHARWGGV